MECPIDAEKYTGKEVCLERNGEFRCSRDKGHKGAHHAHGITCLKVWD